MDELNREYFEGYRKNFPDMDLEMISVFAQIMMTLHHLPILMEGYFQKMGLKVGEIKSAEKIKGSKKLLKMMVDLGTETRQLVAGIAAEYSPDDLVGRQIVVVTKLQPAKLMGVESNGMILAASVDGKPVLLSLSAPVPNGTIVK